MTAKPQRRTGAPSANVEDQVAQHYERNDLTQAIFEALSTAGKDLGRLTPDDLAPVDEFHTGGRSATAGAAFAVYDMMRISEGELRFPLHWAASREMSFVASPVNYRAALKGAGFEIVKARDRGDFARAFFREVAAKSGGEPPPLGIHLLMKTQVAEKLANVMAGLEDGVIAPIELICRVR